jgi:hypothetical protein
VAWGVAPSFSALRLALRPRRGCGLGRPGFGPNPSALLQVQRIPAKAQPAQQGKHTYCGEPHSPFFHACGLYKLIIKRSHAIENYQVIARLFFLNCFWLLLKFTLRLLWNL